MDAPAQDAAAPALPGLQALEVWIKECERLNKMVDDGHLTKKEAALWKQANRPRPPGVAPKAAKAAAAPSTAANADGDASSKAVPKPWPCRDESKCAVAQKYSSFAIGRASIAKAWHADTLFDGVTREHATFRAKKAMGSGGADYRGYFDWEFLKGEQVYSCRLACDTG